MRIAEFCSEKDHGPKSGTAIATLFINEGDKIRIDTRTGEYMERVN